MDRRHSTASDSSTDSRLSSTDGLEGGRISKTLAPKVAVNPLQFVKVGPADLYRSAQEQLKKVEEIKKAKKEHKDEAEEWQSNLDNWKCSRRKRQEHIIERVVEVKKLELEEHERNRRRTKTFNEMMEERTTRGRKSSLPVWNDDSDDLSDLGINNKNNTSSNGGERTSEDSENSEMNTTKELNGDSKKYHNDKDEQNSCSERSKSSNESEEYTYERAIQSYVNFAETRVKSQSSKSIDKDSKEFKKPSPPIPAKPKRGSITKIDTFISQIELNKNKANGDCSDSVKKPIALPKVDVNKRKELFEKASESEDSTKSNKTTDLPAVKSIKERLSSLEKQKENPESSSRNNVNIPVKAAVKERLSNIEKLSASTNSVPRRVSEPLSSQTIKDRLFSFEKSKISPPKSQQSVVEPTVSIKERLNSLHSSCEKEPVKTVLPSVDPAFNEKLSNFKGSAESPTYQDRSFSPDDIYSKRDQHFRHRSLDSLDINQENMSNGSFERVQSLEDLDYRNYPASTFSGDTDREDSGIHTADVSSSVSQADDYDLHLDGNILDDVKMNHQPPIEEETKLIKTDLNHEETLKNVSDEDSFRAKSLTPDSSFSELLPPILENPTETLISSSSMVDEPFVNSYPSPVSSWSSHCNNLETSEAEDASGEPRVLLSDEPCDNNQINNNSNPNLSTCQDDIESKADSNFLTEGDLGKEVSPKTDTSDAISSNSLVSLDASVSEKPQEPCDIREIQHEFDSNMLSSEPVSKYEKNTVAPVTNSIKNSSSINELSRYNIDQTESKISPYENIKLDMNVPIVNQLTDIVVESEPSCLFPLSPAVLEPPKEKPPPPPVENSDDETDKAPTKSKSLRRLDSTKRIKKELRQKRSSFLGLEANDYDSYLEPELELIRPPDMTTLLAEERRVERQLYRQSVCSESDSNQESRDSGVELDHKHHDVWSHSRNDSETFGNQSTTSDEDEIMKKEREIIEALEQEEKIRKQDLGEKLAMRLRELEAEKERWEQLQVESSRNTQNHTFPKHNHASAENLDKCRVQEAIDPDWCTPSSSLQDISHIEPPVLDYRGEYRKSLGDLSSSSHRHQSQVRYASHRRSMPNLQEAAPRRPPPPPPPVIPMKPLQLAHPIPPQPATVAQHIPVVPQQRIVNPQLPNQQIQQQTSCQNGGSGQMTKQTLQALSAAPRSRLISNDSWQVRKKQQRPDNYNYQHWLIQEAEHRRITEQQERSAHGCQRSRRPEGSRHWPTTTPQPSPHQQWGPPAKGKHLPEAIIQTLTQRVQSRLIDPNNNRRRQEPTTDVPYHQMPQNDSAKDKMLSVSGKKRCSHCGDELGRGAAMIIESLQLFYHIDCFKCCVCCIQLGDGLNGTDVRVRNNKLHCHNCYSSDDGAKFSCV